MRDSYSRCWLKPIIESNGKRKGTCCRTSKTVVRGVVAIHHQFDDSAREAHKVVFKFPRTSFLQRDTCAATCALPGRTCPRRSVLRVRLDGGGMRLGCCNLSLSLGIRNAAQTLLCTVAVWRTVAQRRRTCPAESAGRTSGVVVLPTAKPLTRVMLPQWLHQSLHPVTLWLNSMWRTPAGESGERSFECGTQDQWPSDRQRKWLLKPAELKPL